MKTHKDYVRQYNLTLSSYSERRAQKRSEAIIKAIPNDRVFKRFGELPTNPADKELFVMRGIRGRHSQFTNIRLDLLQKDAEHEIIRARTLNLVTKTKEDGTPIAERGNERPIFRYNQDYIDEFKKDSNFIIAPWKAKELWQDKKITNDEYLDMIERWKEKSKYAKQTLKYAD